MQGIGLNRAWVGLRQLNGQTEMDAGWEWRLASGAWEAAAILPW